MQKCEKGPTCVRPEIVIKSVLTVVLLGSFLVLNSGFTLETLKIMGASFFPIVPAMALFGSPPKYSKEWVEEHKKKNRDYVGGEVRSARHRQFSGGLSAYGARWFVVVEAHFGGIA